MPACDEAPSRTVLSTARSRLSALPAAAVPPASIALVALAVFAPAVWNGFVWDDQFNFLENPHYRGLGFAQIRWMLSTNRLTHPGWGGQWIPVTWMTLGLDYLVWGLDPRGYHLTNVLLHAANAVVVYFVASLLLGAAGAGGEGARRLGGAGAALFFALHPLRAESVAWVTERRDVLSGLFFLLTVLLYLRACGAAGRGRRGWLGGSIGCYALALGSKSIVMTLPVVLLVLDAYPLRRLAGCWRARLVEKIPYFLMALAGAALALSSVRAASSLTPLARYRWPARAAMTAYSLWFYLWKTLVPLDLAPLYELPARVNPLAPRFLAPAIAVAAITAAAWLLRRRWPAGLALWLGYGILLSPVAGIVHAGPHLVADRYSYLSCLGWALLVGAGVTAVARAAGRGALRPAVGRCALIAVTVWIVALAGLTLVQIQVWRDSDTLWRSALEADPACAMCLGNLGAALEMEGIWGPAIEPLERALALRPDYVGFHRNLGLALLRTGRTSEAIGRFRLALEYYPRDADLRNYLTAALAEEVRVSGGVAAATGERR